MVGGTPFDAREFRRALGCFPTGVTVICTRESDGTPRGFTANSFRQSRRIPDMPQLRRQRAE